MEEHHCVFSEYGPLHEHHRDYDTQVCYPKFKGFRKMTSSLAKCFIWIIIIIVKVNSP